MPIGTDSFARMYGRRLDIPVPFSETVTVTSTDVAADQEAILELPEGVVIEGKGLHIETSANQTITGIFIESRGSGERIAIWETALGANDDVDWMLAEDPGPVGATDLEDVFGKPCYITGNIVVVFDQAVAVGDIVITFTGRKSRVMG